ncbi:MAG: thiolase C-terminal domain-containing protein [Promethearchaeota archaeon]
MKKVAMVGAGMCKFGRRDGFENRDLFQEAWMDAVKSVDNGISMKDVDGGLYLGNFTADLFTHEGHIAPLMAGLIGLNPLPATRFEGACASSGIALHHAWMSVASGVYDLVVVGGVEKMTSLSTTGVTDALAAAADTIYEYPAGATFPGLYAAIASAHFKEYGTTEEDLFRVGIKNHENGKHNPFAQMPMSIRDIMESKIKKISSTGGEVPDWKDEFDFLQSRSNLMIASPLRLFDCSLVTDGAAVLFLASEDVAKKYTDEPIWITGSAQGSSALSLSDRPPFTTFESARTAAAKAYKMSGKKPENIQIAEVHDCFTIAEIVAMEDLGFYEKGKAVEAIRNGETKRDGGRPINTSGGLKSKGHPVGATGAAQAVEIFKQMRGRAEGERQVKKDVTCALTHNLGGSGASCVVHIYEK